MTPERAAYHALMLRFGLNDAFDREFDEALETEDPLSKLILDLTSTASDINRTIALLRDHCYENPPKVDIVYDLVWKDLCERFCSGRLNDEELSNLAWTLAEAAEDWWNADWEDFRTLEYHYETWFDGMISKERYLQCRELFLTQRACALDALTDPPPKKTIPQKLLGFLKH